MHSLAKLALSLLAVGCVSAYPKTGGNAAIPSGANPLSNVGWYVDTEYTQKVNSSVTLIKQQTGNQTLANLAMMAGNTPTSIWLSSTNLVNTRLPSVLADARYLNTLRSDPGGPLTVGFYIYNLPGRDCWNNGKIGEFPATAAGLTGYKTWIDTIKTKLQAYTDVRVVAIIEPDAVASMIMAASPRHATDPTRCLNATPYYKDAIAYAIKTLQLPHVALYLDIGNAKFNGYPDDETSTAVLVQQIMQSAAPGTVRGWHTNRSQYIPIKFAAGFKPYDGSSDALTFVTDMYKKFVAMNLPKKFLIDTAKNGVPMLNAYTWCNIAGAGMGFRPTETTTNNTLLDAYVWSQAGESDGTGDTSSPKYDWQCNSDISVKPAPEAGQWFHAYFVQLVQNARPPLDAGRPKY